MGTHRLWKRVQQNLTSPPFSTDADFADATRTDGLPDRARIAAWTSAMDKLYTTSERSCTAERIRRWRERTLDDYENAPRRIFDWCAKRTKQRVSTLLRADGSVTGNVTEMDDMIREAWGPILFKYAAPGSEPDWGAFRDEYARYIERHPMQLDTLTAADLRRTLNRMSPQQASGMDGWRVAELKALPDPILARLAATLTLVEETGTWPAALENALVSLIPKGAGGGPLELRPISVASVVYRLWAATRCRDVMRWQEAWLAPGQRGFRLGSTCADVYLPIALRIEKSLLDGTPLVGFSADWAKCFDRYPHDIMLTLLGETGLDPRILGPMRTMYARLQRRFRISGAVGEPFHATQGLLQGCPLSVCGLNCIMAVLSKAVEHRAPGAKFDSYA
eukprot:gene6905-biopygen7513